MLTGFLANPNLTLMQRQWLTRMEQDRKLFYGEHKDVLYPAGFNKKFPYFTTSWTRMLSETWSRVLFGTFPEITSAEDDDNLRDAISGLVKDINLSTVCRNAARTGSWCGESVVKVTFSERWNQVIVRELDPSNVIWEYDESDPERPIGVLFYTVIIKYRPNGDETEEILYYLEEHQRLITPEDDTVVDYAGYRTIPPKHTPVRKLPGKVAATTGARIRQEDRESTQELEITYRCYDKDWRDVPYEQVYGNDGSDNEDEWPVDELIPIPHLLVLRCFNRTLTDFPYHGESDYNKHIWDIQRAANERFSYDQHILNAHSKPTLLIPDNIVQDGNMVCIDDLDWMVGGNDGGGSPVYVQWNGELGASENMKGWLWLEFIRATGLAEALFGVAHGALSGKAKALDLMSTTSEVNAKREQWEDVLQEIVYLAMALEYVNEVSDVIPVLHANTNWGSPLPDDPFDLTADATTQLGAQMIDDEEALRIRYPLNTDLEIRTMATNARKFAQQQLAAQQGTATAGAENEAEVNPAISHEMRGAS
jgi:hypothetical protein